MTLRLSGRARKVLGRFPRHLEADTPGKLIARVTQALVHDQDVQAANLQGIRQAHRLFEARELHDLLLLAGLHGIRRSELATLFARQGRVRELLAGLATALEAGETEANLNSLALQLLSCWGLPAADSLRLFAGVASAEDPVDITATLARLIPSLTHANGQVILLDAVRERITTIARTHAAGNSTIRAILTGTANALDLDLGPVAHSEDRFWHAAPAWDRLRVTPPNATPVTPATEYIGIEENPLVPAARGPEPRRHSELFHTIRKGFDDSLLEIRVLGIGNRTISPMVVNRDSGHGVGIFGQVPDGKELVFTQQGRVLLDGADITSRAYAWQGACFAAQGVESPGSDGNLSNHKQDFVFADADRDPTLLQPATQPGHFVEVMPNRTLNREALLPHAGNNLVMPSIGTGATRFAFFVQQGFFSTDKTAQGPGAVMPDNGDFDPFGTTPEAIRQRIKMVSPRYSTGFVEAALFAAESGTENTSAGEVALHWLEHKAYTVRVLIPNRFRRLLDDDGVQVREQVRKALQRFRPAGIDLQVDFSEDHWVLGKAVLPSDSEIADDPVSRIQSSTRLGSGADAVTP